MRRPLGLVAVLVLWVGLWLPCPSFAGTITGTWNGIVSYQIQYVVDGTPTDVSSGSYMGQMVVTGDPLGGFATISINGVQGLQVTGNTNPIDPFGPTYGAATVIGEPITYAGPSVADFAASYRSILPDGTIDTSVGFAQGDIFENTADTNGTGELIQLSFSSVPEPPSIVTAASALFIAAVIGLKRLLRPRERALPPSSSDA